MFYIQQTSEAGCGYACLKMVLANIRKDKKFLFLPEKENYSLSYKEIIALAKEQGLNLIGFKAIKKEDINKNDIFPIIVSFLSPEGGNHAVVVTNIRRGRVKVLDPDKGIYTLSLSKFLDYWDGTGLLIESDSGEKYKEVIKEPNRKKDNVVSMILQFISGLCCIMGVYFINKSSFWWISIIMFSLFIIIELIHKIFVFRCMNKIDNYYLEDLRIKKDDYFNFFKRLEDYKKQSLSNPISFATQFLVVAFLTYIVIINNIWNTFLVVVPLLLALLNRSAVIPRQQNKEKEIAKEELYLSNSDSIEDYKSRSKVIHFKAYSLGKEIIASRYFNIFVLIINALIFILCHQEFALTQAVFYVVVQQVLFDYMTKLLSYSQKEKEFNLAKARLINVIHQKDENN